MAPGGSALRSHCVWVSCGIQTGGWIRLLLVFCGYCQIFTNWVAWNDRNVLFHSSGHQRPWIEVLLGPFPLQDSEGGSSPGLFPTFPWLLVTSGVSWLMTAFWSLPLSSLDFFSVHQTSLSFILEGHQSLDLGHPKSKMILSQDPQFNYMCKDPNSKSVHIHKHWGSGLGCVFWRGHNLTHYGTQGLGTGQHVQEVVGAGLMQCYGRKRKGPLWALEWGFRYLEGPSGITFSIVWP